MLISKIASRNLPSFFPAVHTQIDTSSPRIVEKNADKTPTKTLFFTKLQIGAEDALVNFCRKSLCLPQNFV